MPAGKIRSMYRPVLLAVLSACALAQGPLVERNVPYVSGGHAEQTLDVYWSPESQAPMVLFIHGGSLLESGERRSSPPYRDVCRPLVAGGISCATMDYRLSPTFQWPAMATDVASAIVQLRSMMKSRRRDPQRLFLFGHSSGCQLAAVVGSNPVYLEPHGLRPSDLAGIIAMGCTLDREDVALREMTADQLRPFFTRDSSEVAVYATVENWLAANPASHLGSHMPPTLVVLARAERFMPPILEQGARFVRRLMEAGVPAELVIVPGTHLDSIATLEKKNSKAFEAIRRFIADPRAAGGER